MNTISEWFEVKEQQLDNIKNNTETFNTTTLNISEKNFTNSVIELPTTPLWDNGSSINWEIIAICSVVGVVFLIIVIVIIAWIIKWIKQKHNKQSVGSITDADIIDLELEADFIE